jgi:hypothetical protein
VATRGNEAGSLCTKRHIVYALMMVGKNVGPPGLTPRPKRILADFVSAARPKRIKMDTFDV